MSVLTCYYLQTAITHFATYYFHEHNRLILENITCERPKDLLQNAKMFIALFFKVKWPVCSLLAVVFGQQKSTHWYVQSQRGLKNHFFHTHYLTTNEPLDVIVLLCYSFHCMRVSIQLLAAIQINQLIDWLIDNNIHRPTHLEFPISTQLHLLCIVTGEASLLFVVSLTRVV